MILINKEPTINIESATIIGVSIIIYLANKDSIKICKGGIRVKRVKNFDLEFFSKALVIKSAANANEKPAIDK